MSNVHITNGGGGGRGRGRGGGGGGNGSTTQVVYTVGVTSPHSAYVPPSIETQKLWLKLEAVADAERKRDHRKTRATKLVCAFCGCYWIAVLIYMLFSKR